MIHVGTNYIGSKNEWFLYRNFKSSKLTPTEYQQQLIKMNPPPASGTAANFQQTFVNLIDEIRLINDNAQIIILAEIKREE